MTTLAVERFVTLAEKSGLVSSDQLARLVAQWQDQANGGSLDDARPLGEFLVRSGVLTAWQSQKLLEGRHRGFLLASYKLLDHLGSGGMSNVYLAEHVLMQRRVAIKVLPQNRAADADYLERFRFEGQAVAALDHPNIVRAYDLGCQGRIHYLVMEYVEGRDLEALVQRGGSLDYFTAAGYIAQAAAGLEHAHDSGLVHRDVKPANLLVDRQGTVKILDMGLAKFKAEVRPVPAFEHDEEVLGTAEYLAPEQALNSFNVDPRADLYGLGCTLYYLLAGHPPFSGRTTSELLSAHHRQTAPSLLVDRPDAPAALVAICRKMMEKEPTRRYQSAREVLDALTGWLDSQCALGRIAAATASQLSRAAGFRNQDDASLSSAMRDTNPNLQETAKISRAVVDSIGAPSDDHPSSASARSAPTNASEPPPPPIVPPPCDAHLAAIPTVAPVAAPLRQRAHDDSAWQTAPRRPRSASGVAWRTSAASGAPHWMWTILLSALVLGAVLLALFAFAE